MILWNITSKNNTLKKYSSQTVIFNTHHASYDDDKIFAKNILYKLLSKSEQSFKMSSKMDELLDGWLRIL